MSEKKCARCGKVMGDHWSQCPECNSTKFEGNGGFSVTGAVLGAALTDDLGGAILGGFLLGD